MRWAYRLYAPSISGADMRELKGSDGRAWVAALLDQVPGRRCDRRAGVWMWMLGRKSAGTDPA